jgi:hypothetical protein
MPTKKKEKTQATKEEQLLGPRKCQDGEAEEEQG